MDINEGDNVPAAHSHGLIGVCALSQIWFHNKGKVLLYQMTWVNSPEKKYPNSTGKVNTCNAVLFLFVN